MGIEIFRACPDRPWGPPASCTMGAGSLSPGKAAGVWGWPPTPEVYLKSRSGSSWPVLGRILSLLSQPLCNRRLSRAGLCVARPKMQAKKQRHIPLETLTAAQLIKNFPAIYSTRKHVHCCGHRTPPLVPTRSQMNSAHPPWFDRPNIW